MSKPVRPKTHWGFDVFVLVLTLGVAIASVLLDTTSEQVTLFGYDVPPLCAWRNFTGMECLGCGLTRSFVFMGHAEVIEAFKLHWMGPALYVFAVAQVPYRMMNLFRHWRLRSE